MMQLNAFEQAREAHPDWEPAFPIEWERPTREELDRVQTTFGVRYSQEFINFQLAECVLTPLGDFAFDGFGWASAGVKPAHSLSEIVRGAQQMGVPPSLAPFRDDNSDFFCLTSSGEVVVWDHNSNGLYNPEDDRWPSFGDWLLASFDE